MWHGEDAEKGTCDAKKRESSGNDALPGLPVFIPIEQPG